MKTKFRTFSLIIFALILVTSSFAALKLSNSTSYSSILDNDFLKKLRESLKNYTEAASEDRVYLHFDKPFYKPGETIWFSAYVRNGSTLEPSLKSEIVHVQLINPRGTVESEIILITENGQVKGDFALSNQAAGGIYKVKAFTNWQKNFGEDYGYTKEIQVQNIVLPRIKMLLDFEKEAYGAGDNVIATIEAETNSNQPLANWEFNYVVTLDGRQIVAETGITDETGKRYIQFELPDNLNTNDAILNIMFPYEGQTESISRSVPIILNNITLEFFPEGGYLINEYRSKVAFRALNEFGKPADIEGIILDKNGKVITSFSSFHQGMGAFFLTPKNGMKYTAKITAPFEMETEFLLPEILPAGYALSVEENTSESMVLNIFSTEKEELSVVAQVRGEIYYTNAIQADKGNNKLSIDTRNFPVGVTQITVFDGKGIPRAERLAFVNKHKQLNISIETDKLQYLPREKVELTIRVTDERGIPMPGNFSVSVANDQLLAFADDKTGNILSQLLLEQDLQQPVFEAEFYFNKEEEMADEALDYLLLTSGWRRFTWNNVLSNNLPTITFNGERTVIGGYVYDGYNYTPLKNTKITVGTTDVKTDENGYFEIANINIAANQQLTVTADDYYDGTIYLNSYRTDYYVYLYNENTILEEIGIAIGNVFGGMDLDNVQKNQQNLVPQMFGEVEELAIEDEFMAIEQEVLEPIEIMAIVPEIVNEEAEAIADGNLVEKKLVAPEAERAREVVDDLRMRDEEFDMGEIIEQQVVYYIGKEFAAPIYDSQTEVEVRTDFRNTIFWNGNVKTGNDGKAKLTFYNSDDITSFNVCVEGIATGGMVGRAEHTYFTQLPFSMSVKVPTAVTGLDEVFVPLTLKNNTDKPITGTLTITSPTGFVVKELPSTTQTIAPFSTSIVYMKYAAKNMIATEKLTVQFKANGLSDAFSQDVQFVPQGFPTTVSLSGNEKEKTFEFNMNNVVEGSVNVEFSAFPSVIGDLLKGVESILQEPSGCFEQTSVSSYPNLLVMDYMQETDMNNPEIMARAEDLLDKGYQRLTAYETPEKGYEWFGGAPAHEALTAYGLMQFTDMKAVYNVSEAMINRTAEWIMSRRDGNGGFLRNSRALDSFGQASTEVTNAYITYALAESGYEELEKELNNSYKVAMESKDPYQLALAANAMFSADNKNKANELMQELYKTQKEDGSFCGTTHSVTRSTGISLNIETTALAVMAMIKSETPKVNALNKAVNFIISQRSGYGAFGSTQGTILALKALTAFAKFSKHTEEAGTIMIYINDAFVAEKHFEAGEKEAITIENLDKYFEEGNYKVTIKFIGVEEALPYSMSVNWNTWVPETDSECAVSLKTVISSNKAKVGENVRLTTTLKNTTQNGLPSTIAIVGIPAGLSPQPWQLKELQDKRIVDFFEVRGNSVVFYLRQMLPAEEKIIHLDLKAEIPGSFQAQASCAYLYYTNEYKFWTELGKVKIEAN